MIVKGGSTDVTTYFAMRLSATGADATGLTISDFDMQYVRTVEVPTAKVDAVALAATNTAHTDNRGIEIDSTDQPGLYRFDWPDAAFAAGTEVILSIKHTSCFTEHLRVSLVAYNPADGVRLGLTALPNAAADAAGGLVISDAGGLDADAQRADVAAILVDTGTTLDGRLPAALVGGRIDANVGAISSDATAADNAEAFFDGTGYAGTNNVIPLVTTTTTATTATNLTNAPTNGDLTAAMKASVTAAVPTAAVNAAAVWDMDATGHQTQGTFGQAIGDPAADTNTIYKAVVTDATLATVGLDVAGAATSADIATAIWQDTTAGDFTVASSIGKALYTGNFVPGAAGGLFIAGSNAATTVNFTGNLSGSVGSVTGAVGSVTGLTASDVGAIKAKTDNLPASPAAVGSAMTLTASYDFAKGTVAVTESYAADGAAPTPVQSLMLIQQQLGEMAISGTTMTVKKVDGSTTAATFTIDSATAPTSITRAT